jgi:ribulose-5-phosphate 4-epimerase/fuculose-1-phosphate aldolase
MEEYSGVKFKIEKNALEKKPALSKSNQDLILEMILCARILSWHGLTPANAGNISAKTKNGILIKATGCEMKSLKPEDFTFVKEIDWKNFKLKKAMGLKLPSSETPMHWLIYKKIKNVNSVIHVHDDALLKKENYEKLGINSSKEAYPYGSKESAEAAIKAFGKNKIAILKDHGVVSVGRSITEAMENILNAHDAI